MASPGDRTDRAQLFRGTILLLFAVLVVNLFIMQVVRHRDYQAQSVENRQVRLRVRPPRGIILDRDGAMLADNVYIADITVPASAIAKDRPDSTLTRLLAWFGLPEDKTLARLAQQRERGNTRLVLIANASMPQITLVEERRRLIPGAQVDARARRRYPHGPLLAHVVGYVSEVTPAELLAAPPGVYEQGDLIGKAGIEAYCEDRLRGRAGVKIDEVNAVGQVVGKRSLWLENVTSGEEITLTLSLALQETLAAAMRGRPGGAIALALPSGEVLAAYSAPAYDPNAFTTGISAEEWQRLRDDPQRPLFNRIAQATYPPGSPYKIVTSLCGLTNNQVGPLSTMPRACVGGFQYGGRFFRCWKKEGHGTLDHEWALAKSCDTFYYQLGLRLSIDQLRETALALGLGRPWGSPFANEAAGNIPSADYYNRKFGRGGWASGVMLNNAIGQGEILVTPLQMAMLMATVATSGRVARPIFVKSPAEAQTEPPRLSIPEEHLRWVRSSLQKVVEEGTGGAARVRGVAVAGKTGTAQNPHGEDHAWFVCYAPAEAPQVAMAIILEHAGHGGSKAAPVASRWLRAYFARAAAEDSLRSLAADAAAAAAARSAARAAAGERE